MSSIADSVQPTLGEGGAAFREYAASLASKHVGEALRVIIAVMRRPGRNSRLQLVAADRILELAGEKRDQQAAESRSLAPLKAARGNGLIDGARLEALRQAKKAERRGER